MLTIFRRSATVVAEMKDTRTFFVTSSELSQTKKTCRSRAWAQGPGSERSDEKDRSPTHVFTLQMRTALIGKLDIDLDVDPPPDVVVEIDTTSHSLHKFATYAALGVSEIWRYDGKLLGMYVLRSQTYVKADASPSFMGLSALPISEFLEISKTRGQTDALRLFRERMRAA